MAIRRAEGFAHFTTASDWEAKGHSYGGNAPTFHPTNGRDGRGCAVLGQNSENQSLAVILPVACAPLNDHVAFYSPLLTTHWWLYTNGTGHDHCHVKWQSDGSIAILRGTGVFGGGVGVGNATFADLLATSPPGLWRANTWHHVQVRLKTTSSGGSFTLLLDGIEVTALTQVDIDLHAGGTQNVTVVWRTGVTGATMQISDNVQIDDVIDNAAEQQWTGLQGDLAVYESVNPTDGDELVWTRSSGAGTWSSHVNQNPQDDDTTYVRSEVAGSRVCFSFPTVTSDLGTILAIKETVCHRKEDATFGAIRLYSRSDDDVDHTFDPAIAAAQSYKFDEKILEKDQKDGASWTAARVNATQLGTYDASDEG